MNNSGSWLILLCVILAVVTLLTIYSLIKTQREQKLVTKRNETLENQITNLEFEHKLLRSAQETVLIVIDQQGNITLANNFAKDFLNQAKLVGKSYRECITIPEVLAVIDEGVGTQERVEKDLQLTLESDSYSMGEDRFLEVRTKFLDEKARGGYTRVIIQDVTERERNETIRKDFVANASHELRTPLAIINGYVETLMDQDVLSDIETSQHFLKIMKRHGERLTRIIEEMLMITKLESGTNNALNLESFPVRDCIEDCLTHLDQLIKDKDVEIKIKMENPDLMIEADRFYLSQILFNLVENAIKQNPDKAIRVNIGAAKSDDHLKIWVSDNGKGIPSADLPFIFRRFYRVAKDHSQQKIKGTGLGLSIVKRAVEAHQGTIDCDSVENKITRFTINLPLSLQS